MESTLNLTCTCSARYAPNDDHDADCDLWLIDEFWAGWLVWDCSRELLVPTAMHPEPDASTWIGTWNDLEDACEEMDEQEMVQRALHGMDQREQDVATTTDLFIERMLNKYPQDADKVWSKDEAGNWTATDAPKPILSTGAYKGMADEGWSNDWSSWTMSDRHCEAKVVLPSGKVTVQATSLSESSKRTGDDPDFSLYLDGSWFPHGVSTFIPWRDFGLPNVSFEFADYAIKEAYTWAASGAIVEVGCIGAHGRTGTVLACMAVLDDPDMSAAEAVTYIRTVYCLHAVESREQEWYVARFHAALHDLPVPPKPTFVPKANVSTHTLGGTTVDNTTPKVLGTEECHFDGPTGKPNKRTRRGGRRARRQQRHHNRMQSR